MAEFRVACPGCGARLKVADRNLIGTEIDCPKCSETFEVPDPDAVARGAARKTADADEPPRRGKKGKRARASGPTWVRYAVGGAVLLVLVVVAVVVWAGRGKQKDTAGQQAAPNAAPAGGTPERPGAPADPQKPAPQVDTPIKLAFDTSRLGYDPLRPDETIPAIKWPRRSHAQDMSLAAYNGRILSTEGRIYGMWGTDRDQPQGKVRTSFYLFDAGGQLFAADGKAVAVGVSLADVMDWKQYRPGQVVRVVGRGRTPQDAPTSLDLESAVVISVSGQGDPPVTPEQLVTAARADPKSYTGGFTTDRHVTLSGTVTDVPPIHPQRQPAPALVLANGREGLLCRITNRQEFEARPARVGEVVTLIGRMQKDSSGFGRLEFHGLYLPKR